MKNPRTHGPPKPNSGICIRDRECRARGGFSIASKGETYLNSSNYVSLFLHDPSDLYLVPSKDYREFIQLQDSRVGAPFSSDLFVILPLIITRNEQVRGVYRNRGRVDHCRLLRSAGQHSIISEAEHYRFA